MKPLDKKQLPQVIVLGILAVAFFGYFIVKMVLPTPAAAGVHTAPPPAETKAPVKAADAAPAADAGVLTAPPPTPTMHDPFIPEMSSLPASPATPPAATKPVPAVRTASLKGADVAPLQIPSVAPLPSVGIRETSPFPVSGPAGLPGVPGAPAAPAAPDWTVTGVLQSGSEHVAILRNGDARRFVKQGDLLDSEFRVASVSRDAVILRHGKVRFTLPLGGAKPAPVKPTGLPTYVPASPTVPALPTVPAPPKPDVTVPGLDISALPVSALRHRVARVTRVAHRYSVCPVIRVADYRIDELPSQIPNAGTGLLSYGTEAPDFSLCTLNGRSFSLSQFRGNVVVLDFWSSWYAPSLRSLAPMDQLQQEYANKGVTVVAVNTWDSRDAMQAALGGRTWNCSLLFDPSISNDSVAVRSYRAPDVPTFYVIDQDGRIAGAFVGFSRSTTSNIKATLAKLGIA